MKFKSLNQYWTLEDEEYKVTVVSPVNLLQTAYADRFTEALNRYDLREIKQVRIEQVVSHPEQFPDLAYGPLYWFEATVGVMPKAGYEQFRADIASWCKVHDSKVFVSEDGTIPAPAEDLTDAPHLNVRPGEYPEDMVDGKIQQDVGSARAKKLVDYLKKQRDERQKARGERDKIFVANHYALAEATGKGYKKGFYRCRAHDGELIVEKAVTAWPERISLVGSAANINRIVEDTQPPKGMFNDLEMLAEQSDNRYLLECACEAAGQAAVQAGHAQPQFTVHQTEKENEYKIETPSEFVLVDTLTKILGEFGATIQSMGLNKSNFNGQGDQTTLHFSVLMGQPQAEQDDDLGQQQTQAPVEIKNMGY